MAARLVLILTASLDEALKIFKTHSNFVSFFENLEIQTQTFQIENESFFRYSAPVERTDELRSIILTEKQKIIAYKITTTPTSPIRLAFFDTDSTFINEEVIDELAAYAGVKDEVAQITERAMRGELDFDSALKERVSLLKGIPENVFSEIRKNRISLTRGARELTQYFKEKDIAAYLVSGGFSYFTQSIADELNLTGQFANTLESIDGILSGNTLGRIVNRERKGEILQELAKKHRVSLENVLAVGDGANDLQMLHLSALGIAFCAKPALLNETTAAIFERDLRFVRYLIDTPNGV